MAKIFALISVVWLIIIYAATMTGYGKETDIFLIGSDYNKNPQRVGHFYGSTDFILEERTQNEKEINLAIRQFSQNSGVNIINVIERDQTSFGFDSTFLDEVYEICRINC